MRRAAYLLALPATFALSAAAAAQQAQGSVDVAATAGYSNDPFAEGDGGTDAGFFALDVTPRLELRDERSTVTLSGLAHAQVYTSRYPVTDSYRLSVDGQTRPSPHLSLFAHVDASSEVLGSDDQYAVGTISSIANPGLGIAPLPGDAATGTGTSTPVTTPVSSGFAPGITTGPLISDIGLLGTRDRRRSVYATLGGSDAVSEHDILNLSGFAELARYKRFGEFSDYNGYGGTVGYSRRLSAFTQVGVQASASSYDYRGTRGTSDVYSVQATGSTRLAQYWTVNAALGASFISAGGPGTRERTSLSGNLELCRQGEYDSFCALVSRAARATGFNGAQYVTTAGANWRHRLDQFSNLTLDGAYVQEGGLERLNGIQNKYLRLAAGYDRQLGERLRGLINARYRRVFGGSFGASDDYGGQIGLAYHFGRLR